MLPEPLDQHPPEQEVATVTADGAFDTRKCRDAIAARGAAAIIPPRKYAKPWKPGFDRQVAEFRVRIAVLDGLTALGISVTEAVGQVCPGKGKLRSATDLRNRADDP